MCGDERAPRASVSLRRQALTATFAILAGILVSVIAAHAVQGRLRDCIESAVQMDVHEPTNAAQIAIQATTCADAIQAAMDQGGGSPIFAILVSRQQKAIEALQSNIAQFIGRCARPADRDQAAGWNRAADECREKLDRCVVASKFLPGAVSSIDGQQCVESLNRIAHDASKLGDEQLSRIEQNRRELQASMGRISWLIDLRGIAPLGVVGLWSLWFFYHSLRRVLTFSTVVRSFASGQLSARMPIEGDDELAQVARQFNEMASAVETSRREIEDEIQQHRQTSLKLQEATEAAHAANRAKSEFLANMSHELRTPLTAILGFTDVLVDNLETAVNVEAAHTIKRNGEYLLEIINDILDLSKIEAGRLRIERVICSPVATVNEVAALMRVRADEKNLRLGVEYEGTIPRQVETDPTRLRQILINLVGNAIKFTEQGSVRIRVRGERENAESAILSFDVIDTGIGMTEAEIGKLFRPFTQADSSTTRNFGGTGLGLTISKRLAELLGGTVTVNSTPKTGSTFRLTIRCVAADRELIQQPGEPKTAWAPKASAGRPAQIESRILLVEDGPDNRRLISYLLTQFGAEVETAENGQEALEKGLKTLRTAAAEGESTAATYDLILMDMQMPLLDGYEATRRLRERGYKGPIVALTAHAMNHDRQRCLEAGCDDYLTKPINKIRLFEVASRYARPQTLGASAEAPADRAIASG